MRSLLLTLGLVAIVASAAGGYRLGTGQWPDFRALAFGDAAPTPPSDHAAAPAAESPASGERKPLYYRNPMGLPDTSPTPKKDWMGMDYLPVYEDEAAEPGTVKITLDRVQRSGVRTERVEKRALSRPVRAPGVAKYDERTMRSITLRADGFVEKLYVNETGRHVKAGEPLFRLYSPDIARALIDLRVDAGGAVGARPAVLTGGQKLRALDVPDSIIAAAKQSPEVPSSFDWPSPVSGTVMMKMAVEGQMLRMGEEAFRIVDLSRIWVIADVAERDVGRVAVGQTAKVRFKAFPSEAFEGRVTFVLHELDQATRTAKVRIEIDNREHRIKHEMYADVEIEGDRDDDGRVAVPNSAVLNSGDRQIVLVARGEGKFEPRAVTIGMRGDEYTEIKDGVAAGEEVVVAANFLIDAESNLKAALAGFTADGGSPATDAPSAAKGAGQAPPAPPPMEDAGPTPSSGRAADAAPDHAERGQP